VGYLLDLYKYGLSGFVELLHVGYWVGLLACVVWMIASATSDRIRKPELLGFLGAFSLCLVSWPVLPFLVAIFLILAVLLHPKEAKWFNPSAR